MLVVEKSHHHSKCMSEYEIRAARRAMALHRRRRYPDTSVCGFCGFRWQVGVTRSGKPASGCPRRRHAVGVLDGAGLVDDQGRLIAAATS